MRWHHRIIGVLAVGAAVAVAALLFAAFGPADALLMGTMAALLAGLYLLRRYARTVLLYPRTGVRRRPTRRSASNATVTRRFAGTGSMSGADRLPRTGKEAGRRLPAGGDAAGGPAGRRWNFPVAESPRSR